MTLKIRKLIATAAVATALVTGGCTVAPKTPSDATLTNEKVDTGCAEECTDEDGASRYQYFLGILSVFLIG